MGVNSDHIFEKIEEVKCEEEITDLELENKIEKSDQKENVKTDISEEKNNPEPQQIIGEKRKNQETSNFQNGNKKTKEEFAVYEESYYKQEEINQDTSNNQVIEMFIVIFG